MRKSIFILLLTLFLAVPVLASETIISDQLFPDAYPVIWNDTAILQRWNGGYYNGRKTFDIFKYDMNTGELTLLANDGYQPRAVAKVSSLYSSSVVYSSISGIKLKDINTLEERILAPEGALPSVYGDKVAYIKADNNIYLLTISDGTELQVTTRGDVWNTVWNQGVDMYGDYIVWAESSNYYTYQISTGQERILRSTDVPPQFDIWENYIVTSDGNFYIYNLNDGTSSPLPRTLWMPMMNKGKIVWPYGGPSSTIGIYDIRTGNSGSANTLSELYNSPSGVVTNGKKVLYKGTDGYYRIFDICTDADNDGYSIEGGFCGLIDCNDNDPSVIYSDVPEIKSDGIDQDCNGYDLTIDVTKATYSLRTQTLTVEATSALNASANLQLYGYGPMTFSRRGKWTIYSSGISNPGTVTVSGVEGSTSLAVTTVR